MIYEKEQALQIQKYIKFNKLVIIHNTIHIKDLSRLRCNLADSKKGIKKNYILYLGKIDKEKNIDMLISYYNYLIEKGYELKLKIIGRGECEYLIPKNSPDIDFLGEIYEQDVLAPHIYNAVATFIPGRVGLVSNHCLAFGTPVITFRSLGSVYHGPEVKHVINNKTGYIIEKNFIEFKDAIDKIRNNRDQFRENCMRYFDKYCKSEKMVNSFLEAISYEN